MKGKRIKQKKQMQKKLVRKARRKKERENMRQTESFDCYLVDAHGSCDS